MNNFWKWWTVLVSGFLAFGIGAYKFDLISEILSRDQTYMTMGMIAIATVASVSTLGSRWTHWHEFITDMMPRLGLTGTVIGFMISLDVSVVGTQLESVDDVKAMIVIVLGGMSVALTTTLAGLILQIWLDLQKRSIKDDPTS